MLDEKALILIAHSDWRTLMALYTLLDAEGYFVAPCFSKSDLLKYCEQYQPELVMTSNPLADDEGGRLLESLKERSPKTRVLLLPDVFLDPGLSEEIPGLPEALPAPHSRVHRNGF